MKERRKEKKKFTDKIGELEIWKMKFGGKINSVTRDFFSFFARHTVYVERERERDYRVRADYGGSVWNRLINGFSDPKKKFLFTFAPKKNKKQILKKRGF